MFVTIQLPKWVFCFLLNSLGCMLLCKQYLHFPRQQILTQTKLLFKQSIEGTFSIKVHFTVLHKPRVSVCVCIGYSGQKDEVGYI